MKRYYQQTGRFGATRAQIQYLRAVYRGVPSKTNGATRARCYRFLVFTETGVSVKPEIVAQFHLDQPA
jgi:hypothetical protein